VLLGDEEGVLLGLGVAVVLGVEDGVVEGVTVGVPAMPNEKGLRVVPPCMGRRGGGGVHASVRLG
jgi:hypothetical protein